MSESICLSSCVSSSRYTNVHKPVNLVGKKRIHPSGVNLSHGCQNSSDACWCNVATCMLGQYPSGSPVVAKIVIMHVEVLPDVLGPTHGV